MTMAGSMLGPMTPKSWILINIMAQGIKFPIVELIPDSIRKWSVLQ